MNRKHFIRLTGVSLGSLLFVPLQNSATQVNELIRPPEKVSVTLDDGVHEMMSADKLLWKYKDVAVQLLHKDDALQVSVQSPTNALLNVQLHWKYPLQSATTILGDHWERTYGDVFFQPSSFDKKLPWYFIEHIKNSTACFGVKTGCSAICYWQLGKGAMRLTMNTSSGGIGVLLGERVLQAGAIVATKNKTGENTFATARRFCGMMCPSPRMPKQPVYGINDWYFAYGRNSSELILQHTSLLVDLATDSDNRPFSVVDAGWAAYSPLLPDDCCWHDDFSKPNNKFKDMHKLATDINKLGMRAGLWTRPLAASYIDKKNLLLPVIKGRDEPKNPILDPTIPENTARIQRNISLYKEWGFDLVKHDYSTYDLLGKWGFQMSDTITPSGWHFNDTTKTTAEIMLHLYKSIRDAAGDKYLIGCNTMSHLSAGLFELNRIGDDTSGNEWERTRKMGVNTLAFRGIHHNRFYAVDADCVGLTGKVPWKKNKQWMQLLADSGTPLFISAQPDAVGEDQRVFIKQCFTAAAQKLPLGEPLDWITDQWPASWKLNGTLNKFDWD